MRVCATERALRTDPGVLTTYGLSLEFPPAQTDKIPKADAASTACARSKKNALWDCACKADIPSNRDKTSDTRTYHHEKAAHNAILNLS